ncbi:hypothetical protein [Pedomonas mirosovicensis]|uniref:hypothetical protein n=1 Tax=Pedomonas mirosovicensis TaxID=2908641 RepID=UPI002169F4BB|nr:hypothetical protein [Pedomonas mirosovicensis]MCH8684205.1 hypothetical protein [Pedomonas mirosovicensis]
MPIRQDRPPSPLPLNLLLALNRTVSQDRWRTYLIAGGFDEHLAHRLYLWNVAVGQSFHYPLQSVEVALRNVIHNALSADYGPEWCSSRDCGRMLGQGAVLAIEKTARLHQSKYGHRPNTTQVVASLSLGFWVKLLRERYHGPLWVRHAAHAFPHLSQTVAFTTLSDTSTRIKEFRNRVFHHEPLIRHDLTKEYSRILQLLGWICPETRDWMRRHASVPRVIRERPR